MIYKLLIVVIALQSLIFAGCGEGGGCSGFLRSGKGGFPVTVEEVRAKEVSPVVTIEGKLIPNDKASVTLPFDAKISEVYVKVGFPVNEGDRLFRISDEDVGASLSVASARRNELEAVIEKNRAVLQGREKMLEEGKVNQDELARLDKEIRLNEAELERARAEIARLSGISEKTLFSSPITGVVTKRDVYQGSVARANDEVVVIVNMNPAVAVFPVDAMFAGSVAVDMPLAVKVSEAAEKPFASKVAFISPEISLQGRTFDVYASIPNEGNLLKAGMSASAEFRSDAVRETFVVSAGSVFSRTSRPYVYRVSKGVAHATPVTISSAGEESIEVISGLERGDVVVVKGGEALFDGAEVNIWRK